MRIKKPKHLIEPETLLPFWLIGSAIIISCIHNFAYVGEIMTGKTIFILIEVISFIVALILIIVFIISILYNIITYINKGKPKDLWKLGYLGLLGILTIKMPFMIVFYGFFAFFGLKKK